MHVIDRERDQLLARFLFESGCSISEIAAIGTGALATDGTLTLPGRVVVISPVLAQTIRSQAGHFLFSSRQTETITPKRIQQILKPYLARVHNGKTTPHVLRYTHIVHAYRQGVPIQAISRQTGLTPVRVAQIVADVPAPRTYTFQSPLGPTVERSTLERARAKQHERENKAAKKQHEKTERTAKRLGSAEERRS